MRITIKYEAVWQNSFLEGSNNEPLPKGGRAFIGSMAKLSKRSSEGNFPNFIQREISTDTVMGVLNRLIGDQRKLYQSKMCPNYFFAPFEGRITFENIHDRSKPLNREIIYIRNMTGSTDQNSFTGMIKGNDPIYSGPRKLDRLLRNVFLYRTRFATGGSCNGSKEEAYCPA